MEKKKEIGNYHNIIILCRWAVSKKLKNEVFFKNKTKNKKYTLKCVFYVVFLVSFFCFKIFKKIFVFLRIFSQNEKKINKC